MNSNDAMEYIIGLVNQKITNSIMIQSYPIADKPTYPFSTVTPTSSSQTEYQFGNISNQLNMLNGVDMVNNDEPQVTLSISSYSNERDASLKLATAIKNFLNFEGDLVITMVSISNVGAIAETNPFIVDNYEFRHTFDVTIRYDEQTKYSTTYIGDVEF